MLSFSQGKPIAYAENKKTKERVVIRDNSADEENPDNFNEFKDPEFTFHQIPDVKEGKPVYIAGPNGSGKSYYSADYIRTYKTLHPRNKIYVFSKLDEDPVIDDLDVYRIVLDEDFLEHPLDIGKFSNSLVLFDDISFPDKNLEKKIKNLRDSMLEITRHNNIHQVVTNHKIYDGKDTSIPLNEAQTVTFFPKCSSFQCQRLLKSYIGLSAKQIQAIRDLPGRWVTIHKNYPTWIMYEHGIYIV